MTCAHVLLVCVCALLVEIPLFHVLSACVTFGNLNGRQSVAEGVARRFESVASSSVSAELIGGNSRVHGAAEGLRHRGHQSSPSENQGLLSELAESSSDDDITNPAVAKKEVCLINDLIFEVPDGYNQVRGGGLTSGDIVGQVRGADDFRDEEDHLLQLAIQQSLHSQGSGGQEQVSFFYVCVCLHVAFTCL